MSNTDRKINEYVNNNLKIMIEVYRDYLYMNDRFSVREKLADIFPREFLKQNGERCVDIVEELYEIISSQVIRDYIKPKYEVSLYYIIQWWIDIQDDYENCIPIELEKELIDEINMGEYDENEDGSKVILGLLKEIEEYLDFCFEDHDFLPDSLDSIVNLYLSNPELVRIVFQIDLDEYIELMSADMRELYLEKGDENKKEHNNILKECSEETIIMEGIY